MGRLEGPEALEPAAALAVGSGAEAGGGLDGGFGYSDREGLAGVNSSDGVSAVGEGVRTAMRKNMIDGDHGGVAKGDTGNCGGRGLEVEDGGSAGRGCHSEGRLGLVRRDGTKGRVQKARKGRRVLDRLGRGTGGHRKGRSRETGGEARGRRGQGRRTTTRGADNGLEHHCRWGNDPTDGLQI